MKKKCGAGGSFCRLIHRKTLSSAGIFRFAGGRKTAQELLRVHAARMRVPILNYCILPGEIFILADASSEEAAILTGTLFAQMSRAHNTRKHHEGPCWKGRPHVMLAQKGACTNAASLALSMLPADRKLVRHPSEWKSSGFRELAGISERYRIIDRKNICRLSGLESYADFSRRHLSEIELTMEEPHPWQFPFDALALGDERGIGAVAQLLPDKFREIRRCRITGGLHVEALFVSQKWGQAISRSI